MGGKVWTYEEIMALQAENQKLIKELVQSGKETDRKMAETDRKMAETDRKIAELGKQINGISASNGMVAEEVVYTALNKRKSLGGVAFDDVEANVRKKRSCANGEKIEAQYDVVLYNCSSVALVEAKYRVRLEDIEWLIERQMPKFKRLFPEYKDCKVYLGIGGMSFDEGVEEEALRKGVATIKLDGDAVVEINDKNIKAWD